MKLKKTIAIIAIITIFIAQISIAPLKSTVYAVETQNINSEKFHYQQLDNTSKKIYDGIYEMYTQRILETGTENFDLAQNDNYITQEQIENYMQGKLDLKKAMNAARYAFYADHPEIFYVNFQNLSLRITQDITGKYHANIGSGNLKTYYVEGFTEQSQVKEAIQEFNTKVNEIVEGANNLQPEEGKNLEVEKIKYVHNEIIYNTSYRLESDCTPGNEGYLSTPYGALIKKQAVCEGYARALKTILDKLEINCILVQGIHQIEGSAAVPHMWNYVQIEKETNARSTEKVWYAVDATFDDPYMREIIINEGDRTPGADIVEGFENTRYCLVGTETMNKEHIALETVEAAGNYVFEYPELNTEDYGISTVTNNNGLLVKFKQEGTETEEYKAGDYYISYNNKGWAEAAKEGKYLIMKSYYYLPADEEWDESRWAYLDPEPYAGGFVDKGDHIYITIPNSEYVEFAVTTLAPDDSGTISNLTYQGDETDFIAKSEKLYNPNGTYKGRPYIISQTPAATSTMTVGPTYHIDVTYDDDLILKEGETAAGYRLESTGATGAQESQITNFQFDGKNRITFDLKFSQMYADDNATYIIYITGLVGANSGREPIEISYGARNQIACAFSMNKAQSWDVFARPTLLENQDLSMEGWKTSDGTPVSEQLKSRIALVTTKTTTQETEEMTDLMENELGNQELITSETYNISLNVCRKYVVQTGHKLRLSVGFPAGYGPEDAGVTFKAYHFGRNSKGEVTKIEEIPCVVTPYGLIITCDSFSPFAIAVVENDGTETSQEKAAIVSATEGGYVEGANREEGNIITLLPEGTKEITIKADEGYEIETINICGKAVEITNKKEMKITVKYEDIKSENCIINATFVAQTVAEKDIKAGETLIQPISNVLSVAIPTEILASLNKTATITPNIKETEGTTTYQWYKEGIKLEGKTNKELEINEIKTTDAGNYTLKTTTTNGTETKEAESNECKLTVRGYEITTKTENKTVEKGKEINVDINIENCTNIGQGVLISKGQLEYDTNILERISITGKNGWEIKDEAINEENLKFILENDERIVEDSELITIKFKVKDTITEETETTIKIKDNAVSGGYGIIKTDDVELAINITIPEEPAPNKPTLIEPEPDKPTQEEITSKTYKINNEEKDISKIAPKTTITQFKEKVITEQEITFIDEQGNTITDNNAIITTGTTIKVGKTLQYTLIVTGDTDGDGEITVNDIAQMKLHCIEYKQLEGIQLKAADLDDDKEITINDIAQAKLVIIGLLEIK